jgi:predicted transcriptional regulator of viral defense system
MNSSHQELIALFKQHHGYLQSKDLQRKRSLYYALELMQSSGDVEQVRRGLYHLKSMQDIGPMQEVAQIYPNAVFCLISAWQYYDLSTQIPHVHHLAFPHKTKIKQLPYPPIQAYYWSEKFFSLEVVEQDGIRIYSLEKSVCDAIKFRNKLGTDLMSEVLKNYLSKPQKDLNKLIHIAGQMSMKNMLRAYLDLLM